MCILYFQQVEHCDIETELASKLPKKKKDTKINKIKQY